MEGVKARRARRSRVNRSSALTLRCTSEERAEIEARAQAAGLLLSEFVRVSARTVTIRARRSGRCGSPVRGRRRPWTAAPVSPAGVAWVPTVGGKQFRYETNEDGPARSSHDKFFCYRRD